jgi:hypothetical protein
MQHVFGKHIGSTVEAYVDDIIVKTKQADDLVNDLDVAFKCLRAKNIKLNPEKCVFGVPRGMLLGFIVSKHGIEANPEKNHCDNQDGPHPRSKGRTKDHGLLSGTQPFHFVPRRKSAPSVPPLEEIGALFLDPRG